MGLQRSQACRQSLVWVAARHLESPPPTASSTVQHSTTHTVRMLCRRSASLMAMTSGSPTMVRIIFLQGCKETGSMRTVRWRAERLTV